MSVNSSASSNASLPRPLFSSLNVYQQVRDCWTTQVVTVSITAFTIASVLIILPLCVFVLYLGFQRWRQQRSNTTVTHSDLVTYHMIVTELLNVLGFVLFCCAVHTDLPQMSQVGVFLLFINCTAQTFFHPLTCVERYLAVVHPITYLKLRKEKGIRIINVSSGCVWLLCIAWSPVMSMLDHDSFLIINFCILGIILSVVSFCSISVLCVLMHPGPGEGGRARQQVDQSKLRAFYTIMVILGVLLLRLGGSVLAIGLFSSPQLRATEKCAMWISQFWFFLPSSLVLPLLFLHRAGKLPCCKNNNESGQ